MQQTYLLQQQQNALLAQKELEKQKQKEQPQVAGEKRKAPTEGEVPANDTTVPIKKEKREGEEHS